MASASLSGSDRQDCSATISRAKSFGIAISARSGSVIVRFTAPPDTVAVQVLAGDFLNLCSSGTYEWDDFSLREM